MNPSNTKKKILLVITKAEPMGGAQRYVYDLATCLPASKFDVAVACGYGNALKEKLREVGIRVIELEHSQRDIEATKDWRAFSELRKVIKEEKPDVLHLNSSKAGGLGALAGRLEGVPKIIFTGHGWAFNENRSFLSRAVIIFLHWLTILLTHTTIAVSDKTKRDIDWLPFVKNKIKVVYNGVGKIETLTKKEAREFFQVDPKKVLIFSLSELHKNKGIDLAIKALKILPEDKKEKIIYCVGGRGEEQSNLEKLIQELGMGNSVKLLGFVENGSKLLAGADIFLMPSRTEALPYSLLEAGAAGLPIIATSVGGMPEVIKDMQNGILVYPNNPTEIAEAISYLLDHKTAAKEFGKEIKKTVHDFYSLKRMAEETIKLY
jgi:glycosyltransferase involved in cell wall biosynthesis